MQKTIPITGLELGVAKAGLKRKNKADLLLIRLKKGAQVAGVFTKNKFRAAPVEIASNNLVMGGVRALVVNTGVANAGTGRVGLSDAKKVCEKVGNLLKNFCIPPALAQKFLKHTTDFKVKSNKKKNVQTLRRPELLRRLASSNCFSLLT